MNDAPTPDGWISEDELCARLSVERAVGRQHRPKAPSGCVRQRGRVVEWSHEGALWLAAELAIPVPSEKNAPPEPDTAEPLPQKKADEPEQVTVISRSVINGRHFANQHIIQCARCNGEKIYVRVMDSAKYQPFLADDPKKPMTLRAKKARGGNWWEMLDREPRWRGRW